MKFKTLAEMIRIRDRLREKEESRKMGIPELHLIILVYCAKNFKNRRKMFQLLMIGNLSNSVSILSYYISHYNSKWESEISDDRFYPNGFIYSSVMKTTWWIDYETI